MEIPEVEVKGQMRPLKLGYVANRSELLVFERLVVANMYLRNTAIPLVIWQFYNFTIGKVVVRVSSFSCSLLICSRDQNGG